MLASAGAPHPWLGDLARLVGRPLIRAWVARRGLLDADSRAARNLVARLRTRLAAGETVRIAGITVGSHDAGLAVLEAGPAGARVVCCLEEERFSGRKHEHRFPRLAAAAVGEPLDAVVGSWDYVAWLTEAAAGLAAHLPRSLAALLPRNTRTYTFFSPREILDAPARLHEALGVPPVLVGLRHHDNHAAFSYAASPFAADGAPTLVLVLDGQGDDGTCSAYVGERGSVSMLAGDRGFADSLGAVYAVISSTQGGWTQLSSEGRFMGAAAWGDGDRLTNPYYRRLRQLVWLGADGRVHVNAEMADWVNDPGRPYAASLRDVLGEPVPPARQGHPDAVIDLARLEAPTRDRLDKAAALQMVFEDAVFHVVEHLVTRTGISRLVWTGGTALNALCSMRLLERLDEAWFARRGMSGRWLELWVPPVPSDAGVALGAACNLAMRCGVAVRPPAHAFLGGEASRTEEILGALAGCPHVELRDVDLPDLAAWLISRDLVVGLFQGVPEIGPRALGHRSILASPRRADMLDLINQRVKLREPFRPLAPMVTREAAERLFYLPRGAAAGDYDVLRWMVVTVRAREEARVTVPAVVHRDGTSRIQIVRAADDPFCHAMLRALGRRIGVECCVNTSLNVAAPVARTPAQAVETMRRARGLDGLLLVGHDGRAFLAWDKRDPRAHLDAYRPEDGPSGPPNPVGGGSAT